MLKTEILVLFQLLFTNNILKQITGGIPTGYTN